MALARKGASAPGRGSGDGVGRGGRGRREVVVPEAAATNGKAMSLWDLLDDDRDGVVTLSEWEAASKKVDADGDGHVSRKEFSRWTANNNLFDVIELSTKAPVISLEAWRRYFRVLDVDSDGLVSKSELRVVEDEESEFLARLERVANELSRQGRTENQKDHQQVPVAVAGHDSGLVAGHGLPKAAATQNNAVARRQLAPSLARLLESKVPWTTALQPDTVIEYFTDVEGSWEYFVHFVQKSSILGWTGDPRGVWGPGRLELRRHGILVFGGDASDKGPGDIRVIKLLTQLKKLYPEQVFLVLGNRDLTKLRFCAELDPALGNRPAGLDEPYMQPWEPKCMSFADFLIAENLPKNRVSKLKWLLHCTMGCQWPTFQTRKDELACLAKDSTASDEDVLHSYTSSVDAFGDDPWMLEFLLLGQIACVLGDTLFVHGGLTEDSMGVVPGQTGRESDVRLWAQRLNEWKDRELDACMKDPAFYVDDEGCVTRAASELIFYGTPGYGSSTVIYYNPFLNGNSQLRTEGVQDYLEKCGIKRVLSGHQPHGQTPSVVRHMRTGLLCVTGDTSRSDASGCKVFNPNNNRGAAISVISIEGPWLKVRGELINGKEHGFKLHVDHHQDVLPDKLVGRQLIDDFWVKTVSGSPDQAGRTSVSIAFGEAWTVKVMEMEVKNACVKLKAYFGYGEGDLAVLVEDMTADTMKIKARPQEVLRVEDEDREGLAKRMRQKTQAKFDREAFMKHSTFVFSYNGIMVNPDPEHQAKIVANVNRLIASGKRVVFVFGQATRTRQDLWNRISGLGITVDSQLDTDERLLNISRSMSREKAKESLQIGSLVTSSQTAAWYLSHRGIKAPFCVTFGAGLIDELRRKGITGYHATVDESGKIKEDFLKPCTRENIEAVVAQAPDVDAVVIGFDPHLTALTISVAAQFIYLNLQRNRRIPVVTCSTDARFSWGTLSEELCPGLGGVRIEGMGTGSMTEAICRVAFAGEARTPTGQTPADRASRVEAVDCGKPSEMFSAFLRWPYSDGGLQIDPEQSVFVGQSMDTDIVMANSLGMHSLLVFTGATKEEEYAQRNRVLGPHSPTWTLDSFANVFEDEEVLDSIIKRMPKLQKESTLAWQTFQDPGAKM